MFNPQINPMRLRLILTGMTAAVYLILALGANAQSGDLKIDHPFEVVAAK